MSYRAPQPPLSTAEPGASVDGSRPATPPHAPRAAMSPLLIIGMLALLLGLQPLSTDLYLPALPLITDQLSASVAQTQATFTAMLLAFGCSQLIWGPASDRWGRRPILLLGVGGYSLLALSCALAPSMAWLIVLRTLQGAALGAAVMAARAIVRDLYAPAQGAQVMSKALSGLGIIVCSSPLLGSWVATHISWRATMLALALVGSATWLLIALRFQETIPQRNPHALQWATLWRTWKQITRHRTFLAYTLTSSCSYAGVVVFLTGSSFTFIQVLGWSPQQVGLMLACNGIAFITGTVLCRRLLPRWGIPNTVAIAGSLAVLCGTVLVVNALCGVQLPIAYAAPCMLFSIAHGMQQACGQSGAVSPFPQAAGTASALNGFLMMVVAFTTGQWLGASLNGTVYPLVFGIAWWACCTALASWTLVRKYGAPAAS